MSHATSRHAIDLDEIERQLAQEAPSASSGARKGDPLAELARIVGQDDPFRSLLEPAPRQAQAPRPAQAADAMVALRPHHEPAPRPTPRTGSAAHAYDDGYGAPDATTDYHLLADEPAPPRRSRRSLVMVGALMGVAVVGVSGALMMRSNANRAAGEPVVVQAERTPLKVQPQNPGGVVIPDQNRQIYQPGSGDGQIRVVNREEQPVDVRSAVTNAGAAPSAAPAAGPNASALIGEPRRVRTVAVRPDGTMAERPAPSGAQAAQQPPTTAAIPASATPAPPRRPQAETRTTAAPPAPATRPSSTGGNAPDSTTGSTSPRSEPRPAARVAAQPPAEAPAAAPRGNFVVQFSSSPNEAEAKAKVGQIRQRYAGALNGQSPFVRRAEVNGNATYRVRVGPMSREDASTLCSRVKESGGACIVASN